MDLPLDMGDGNEIHIHQRVYRGLTVWFAIMHNYTDYGKNHEVQRIDCCHSEIHVHLFSRTKRERRRVIVDIDPANNAWETVDAEYPSAYERCVDDYEENYRRWRDA